MYCSLPGFSVHGIFQARILEWDAISFLRGSSQLRDQTGVSCIGRWILHHWATWECFPLNNFIYLFIFGCAGSLLLDGLFSSYIEWGLFSSCGARDSHCGDFSLGTCALGPVGLNSSAHGLSSCDSQPLEHRLGSCSTGLSCSVARRIFPDQGWNPCPLSWQVDSFPLSHLGRLTPLIDNNWALPCPLVAMSRHSYMGLLGEQEIKFMSLRLGASLL